MKRNATAAFWLFAAICVWAVVALILINVQPSKPAERLDCNAYQDTPFAEVPARCAQHFTSPEIQIIDPRSQDEQTSRI